MPQNERLTDARPASAAAEYDEPTRQTPLRLWLGVVGIRPECCGNWAFGVTSLLNSWTTCSLTAWRVHRQTAGQDAERERRGGVE